MGSQEVGFLFSCRTLGQWWMPPLVIPLPGRLGGVGGGAGGQAGSPGECAWTAGDDGVVRVIEHHRQGDAGAREGGRVDFDEAGRDTRRCDLGQHRRGRREGSDAVERTDRDAGGTPEEEGTKITNVDDLHRR